MGSDVRFVEDLFPLLISVGPTDGFDAHQVELMAAYYTRLFKRGKRYSVLSCSPKDGLPTNARGRKLIVDWAQSKEVRENSAKLCVGSATVVSNALSRGALTAILWVWSPAAPHLPCATVEEGLDWCLQRLRASHVAMPEEPDEMRRRALELLREHAVIG